MNGNKPYVVQDLQPHFTIKSPWWKQAMDLLGSVFLIILLAPLFIFTAILIKLLMPGPVMFTQIRAGKGGVPFKMYKFRSMVVDAEQLKAALLIQNERDGPAFKMNDDPRITPFGHFIRKSSLDELPQLINVLIGDMSLVGPRPLPVYEDKNMSQWHVIRRELKPGITGLWQISARDNVNFDHWIRLDLFYINNLSLQLDIKILLKTIPAVLFGRGAM